MAGNVTVLHVVAGLHPRSGGTSRVVVDIIDALTTQSHMAITLLTQSRMNDETVASTSIEVRRVVAESRSHFAMTFGLPFRDTLNRIVSADPVRLIHNHGLWHPVNHWAASAGRRYGIPLIMQPHGMLEPWALNHKVWKKRIAMALFQRLDLEAAKLLVATSPVEYLNIRKLGFRQPIAVIPHGVVMPPPNTPDVAVPATPCRERIALFLSRVHPKKGLLNLVNAWANVTPQGWKLRIVGPDEGGHLEDVIRAVQQFGIGDSVEYLGEVDGVRKSVVYQSADLFVLPSFSENFGVVVAEALAHGVPVITTRVTPWGGLLDHGCGWWIEPTVNALTETLREALDMDATGLRAMGEKGRTYAAEFDWSHIARQTEDAYSWVLGQGAKPECVVLD
jgi:glycosyltransferase involved in cell wall biosynthesis